ncbi:AMP nucleosidase [Sandaracinobacteroides saxicola]|uniref:AMP nucleosidase n=1 Tax=Sandaracinobacteroides saxicola TaxID=2759707 RepID=A0A7G5IEG2_9SPHN|nr:AMP nucleosidase [Sandaracinobacteroides saxicola]QMW21754.1 AMP nucleosidase [Sandaracinobacteroides saxicola]
MNSNDIVNELAALHAQSVVNLRDALKLFLETGTPPSAEMRAAGAFAYPELHLASPPDSPRPRLSRAYARLVAPGDHAVTITHPSHFRRYLTEQLDLLMADYDVTVSVRRSGVEIPFPYVLDGATDLALDATATRALSRHFPTTELAAIGDELADGIWNHRPDTPRPLALFDAPRIDFSLARLKHYTGAPAHHTQNFILFTNYHRYVDEFVRWSCAELNREGTRFTGLSCAGGVVLEPGSASPERAVADGAWRRHQMPAYHLMAPDGSGVTLVNIGVGPSNAKTITDHLAVLRPQAWLMIGHCGGLRPSQSIGDYVLAHAYLRDDHVLDDMLSPEIPIPPIAEVQQALYAAALTTTGLDEEALKPRLRTGTVVTTDDRNWELRFGLSARRFNQSRAVAVDMESATIAAQGYRFRVPYGTLLCVSDKPLHGEIKLPGQANRFYEGAISEHLQIGIACVDLLREAGPNLHSRKLRAFDEPPFR